MWTGDGSRELVAENLNGERIILETKRTQKNFLGHSG